MYQHYHAMLIFANYNVEIIKNGYRSLVRYAATSFSVLQIAPLTLWKNVFEISVSVDKYLWEKTLLLIEIALLVPQSNAVLERLFNQLKYVKSNLFTNLLLQSLNALLRIRVTGPSLQIFYEQHVKIAVNFWNNSKERRIHQHKKRKTGKSWEN